MKRRSEQYFEEEAESNGFACPFNELTKTHDFNRGHSSIVIIINFTIALSGLSYSAFVAFVVGA